ncbi:MYG1 exonuclease-like isoform X1 [Hylaeus volcanicus]|uniref:MYG1 exonuclease-like isoform X1 n=2 Tax=Hylaeus volcanicus TaxID=313075 RepID=UPI0023B83A7A|nr:MYG1 exonuclease-like isoform X1 [Hylaeus volcanicus]
MLRRIYGTISTHQSNLIVLPGFLTSTRNFLTMTKLVKIGTHDGCFHCDEALAYFLLKILPQYKHAIVVRTRDPTILDTCDIVIDVGGEYNPSKHRYDHHMRDFKESLSTVIKKPGYDSQIKLSSAGLIYCHFGHEIIKQLAPEASEIDVEKIFKKIYDTFIKEIDGIDNGIPMYDGEPAYRIVTDLSARVQFLNPTWNSENSDIDEQFLKAVELTGEEFKQHINYAKNVWLPARSIVEESINKRFEVDPSGEIIELTQRVPWSEHLFAIEKEMNLEPKLKYLIFKDDTYRIRGVPVAHGSFVCRIFLPEAWAGLRDEELERTCGIEGAIFVHSIRFIGGHKTREGALMMARKAIEIGKST